MPSTQPAAQQLPDAVLWDMDGTLVDTEPYWMAAEGELVRKFGGEWGPAQGTLLIGLSLERAAGILQEHGVPLEVEEIVQRLSARVAAQLRERVPWRPGSRELLTALREAGVPTALVTMSRMDTAGLVLEAIGEPVFDAVVTAEQVRPKPLPDPYLRAAELLGVDAGRCVALEDSETGIRSAVAAGAVTIAVPLHAEIPQELGHERWTGGAEGRGLAELAEVFARHVAEPRA